MPLRVDGRSSTSLNRLGKRGEFVERHEIVGPVAGDPQRSVDDAAHRLAARLQPRVIRGEHDSPHQQPRRRFRQQNGLGVATDADRVLAHDLVGEAVVRRDRRAVQQRVVVGRFGRGAHFAGEGVYGSVTRRGCLRPVAPRTLELAEQLEPAVGVQCGQSRKQPAVLEFGQPLQSALDALCELARRLAGEGEAEHLIAADDPVRDQPHDARGHGLGLSAAGAGDDQGGSERRLDHGGLLVGRRELAERSRDHVGRQSRQREGCRHDALTAPIV